MAKIVILGAGLTGLSTAYHLESHGFFDYKLFEKEQYIGGLCRSSFHDGFTFDYAGHLLHINDPYVYDLIKKTVRFKMFNELTRNSFIYSNGVYTDYPFQTNLFGLPETVINECIDGFIKRKVASTKSTNWHEWILQTFGAGFGKHFFFPYQEKLFSYDIKKLTSSWTGRFVPNTTLEQITEGANQKNKKKVGYNATFFYPKAGGIISWVKQFSQFIINQAHTGFCANQIDLNKKTVHFTNGHVEPFEQLITTMPLDKLLRSLKETSKTNLQKVHEKLLCTSVVNFNLGLARENVSDKHWVYYPEKELCFYRIGFPHTFSPKMAHKKRSSLSGELSYLNLSLVEIKKRIDLAFDQTMKMFSIENSEIISKTITAIPHAYVIYDAWRENNIKTIHQRLNEQSIFSVGRYGEWKYSSMQEAILDGKNVAEKLLTTSGPQLFPASTSLDKTKELKQQGK